MRFGLADARIDHRARFADGFGRPDVAVINVDQRPARHVPIHHHLEDVVVQIEAGEIPVVVVGFVEEVETVLTFDPPDLDLDVHVLQVVVHAVALLGVHELVHTDGVAVGHDGPIAGVAVDARDLVGRELKNLEGDVGPFHTECGREEQCGEEDAKKQSFEHGDYSWTSFFVGCQPIIYRIPRLGCQESALC